MENLKRLNLRDLSDLNVDFSMVTANDGLKRILIIKCSGTYRIGSAGDGDALYMLAMGRAALAAWSPSGVILDWSELDYQWGDLLEMVLDVGVDQYLNAPFPRAVIVGDKCEEAFKTLILGFNGEDSIEKLGYVFRDIESGVNYIASY
ncbi:hypothetical protein D3C73_1040250 [compost metagenome]